jgi:C4-dicarboxylate-specific signal transduction histidine kinase
MDQHDGQLLRREGLAFFGAIIAGQSHEVTNVLNIINELAGLQGDVLRGVQQGQPIDVDKLKQIIERIQNQVHRGEAIVRCMNRFAHSADCPVTVFDLKEGIEQIASLAQRSATLAKTILGTEFPKESMPLETSPFGLKQAVFGCIEIALAASTRERRITVAYRVLDQGAEIAVRSADPILPEPNAGEKEAFLALLMRQLGGEMTASPCAGDSHRFLLFFPRPTAKPGVAATLAKGRAASEDFHET